MEGPAHVVGVEAGNDDLLAAVGELGGHLHQILAIEVRFVDAHHLGAPVEPGEDLAGPSTTSAFSRWSPCETISSSE